MKKKLLKGLKAALRLVELLVLAGLVFTAYRHEAILAQSFDVLVQHDKAIHNIVDLLHALLYSGK